MSTGHTLSYIDRQDRLEAALVACAHALRPGGVLALDLKDLSTLEAQMARPPAVWVGDDWAMFHGARQRRPHALRPVDDDVRARGRRPVPA